ncbi:MAG: 50S ribosomal protein L10 [Dehalococcoidia bacterium]
MPTKRKIDLVEKLTGMLTESEFVISTNYRGLTVAQIAELRRQLREIGIEYHVVKNNLARFAANSAGKEGLSALLKGPVALAFGDKDITQPAKVIADYARASKSSIKVTGGYLDNRVLTASDVSMLATMPPIEVLRAILLGTLQAPIYALQTVLSANVHGLYAVLNARIQQLGGTANA